jgi:Leucine-rich repeat (LRR) protein
MESDKYTKKEENQKDNANETFSQIIEKKKRNISELSINEHLYGNLNLSILSEKGFSKIEILRFSEGSLTSLTNIPTNIKKIVVSNQLLKKIELPDNIEHLEIENNFFVGEFSLKKQRNLKYLNISFNKIKTFGDENILPETLEELYCHHNLLQNLYLKTCPKLRILHCDNNPNLKIYNISDTVTDIRLPEKVIQFDDEHSEKEKDKNELQNKYQESIQDYFNIKSKYENSLKKNKNTLPKCYGCKRNVGMIFSGKNQKYTAYCGDTSKPCDWKIVLHRGDYYNFRDTMEEMKSTLEETKEDIIRQKMNTLFDYINETESAELFKEQLTSYKLNQEEVEKNKKRYEDMYFNEMKKEIIQRKQKEIQELLMELNQYNENGEIERVVKIQNEIKGISEFIQRENYEFMEMWFNTKKGEFRLDQQIVNYSKLEINHGEAPKVE